MTSLNVDFIGVRVPSHLGGEAVTSLPAYVDRRIKTDTKLMKTPVLKQLCTDRACLRPSYRCPKISRQLAFFVGNILFNHSSLARGCHLENKALFSRRLKIVIFRKHVKHSDINSSNISLRSFERALRTLPI